MTDNERDEALRLIAGWECYRKDTRYAPQDLIDDTIAALASQSAPCQYIRSSDEGTHYCVLAQSAPHQEPKACDCKTEARGNGQYLITICGRHTQEMFDIPAAPVPQQEPDTVSQKMERVGFKRKSGMATADAEEAAPPAAPDAPKEPQIPHEGRHCKWLDAYVALVPGGRPFCDLLRFCPPVEQHQHFGCLKWEQKPPQSAQGGK